MATSTSSAAAGKEALEKALPPVISGISIGYNALLVLFRFTKVLFGKYSPLRVVLYVMAPFFVFFEAVIQVLIYVPYGIFVSLSETFYPIYVFCGVALITGGILGLIGRVASNYVVDLLEKPPLKKTDYEGGRIPGKRKGKAKSHGEMHGPTN